jgi:hypothetical protein
MKPGGSGASHFPATGREDTVEVGPRQLEAGAGARAGWASSRGTATARV